MRTPFWCLFAFLFVALAAIVTRASRPLLLGNEKIPVNTLFELPAGQPLLLSVSSPTLRLPLPVADRVLTTVHIDEWSTDASHVSFFLHDETTNKTRVLSDRPINRHRDFDLTPDLTPGHPHVLGLTLKTQAAGQAGVEELTVRSFPTVPAFPPLHAVLAVAFLITCLLSRMMEKRPLAPLAPGEIAGLLVLVAFFFRWRALGATAGQPLEGDAGGYRDLALALSWANPFQNGIREPFYVWFQNGWSALFGTNILAFRLATLAVSVASIPVLYFLCVALSGRRAVGVVACLLVAVGDYAVFDAVRGERNQLFTWWVLVFGLWIVKMAPAAWKREAGLGVVGGLLSWTWLAGLIGVVLAYGYRWWAWRVPVRRALAFWITLAVMTVGFLYQQKMYRGDPLQALNVHVNFYKNAKETGVPSYNGEKSSWVQHVLRHQGVAKVAMDSVSGTAMLFLNPFNSFNKTFLGFHYSQPYSYFLFPFLILGMAAAVRRRRVWGWVLALSFLNLSASLLNDVRDPRLFYHLLPFFAYFFAAGVVTSADVFRRKS